MGTDLHAAHVNALVSGAATDSRKVREGDLFFAMRGRTDGADFAPEAHLRGAVATDRKSTRLNSSHANISYAVFCLENTTELQSRQYLVCRLLLEKKKKKKKT